MNLSALFKPRSLAIVGASARGGPGAKMLATLRLAGFTGEVWPVSRTSAEIEGFRSVPSLEFRISRPDCLLIAVPAEAVAGVREQGAALGIPAALIVS
jgi:acetate---CoA ligase (ADP-forming)